LKWKCSGCSQWGASKKFSNAIQGRLSAVLSVGTSHKPAKQDSCHNSNHCDNNLGNHFVFRVSPDQKQGKPARQEQKSRLAQAQRKLAAMKDPLVEVKEQLDKAAFIIVYQADRKYNELDLKESAIADYRQVIKLYPQTMWAGKAQERLNGIDQIGDLL
jgi:TolA-binding protein